MHGFLQAELGSLIRNHLRANASACDVIANPGIIPRLLSDHNLRIPDLGVTCAPHAPGQATLPDPFLLIEILSPGNQAKTWSNVWAYTSIPSVQEIVVLHSTRIGTEILRRTTQGDWPEQLEQRHTGDLMFASIGLRLFFAELYARTGLTERTAVVF